MISRFHVEKETFKTGPQIQGGTKGTRNWTRIILPLISGEQIWSRSKLVYMAMSSLGFETKDFPLNWRVKLSKSSINHMGNKKNQVPEL